ncbi:hypothetical protein [Desulfocicer vacuolatum]|nr:hypothetical protein [Desulfocicer vacuolatum]
MINLKFKKSYVSISGDYYQIKFDDEPDEPIDVDQVMDSLGPYFLIQFNFEFPGSDYYIESDDEALIGHYVVNSVILGHRTFTIKYGIDDRFIVKIEFGATDEEQNDLINVSKEMFLNVQVKG